MAKYVCDFAQVTAMADKLTQAAEDLESNVTNYSSRIESDLATWTGAAKSNFQTQCTGQIQQLDAKVKAMKELGKTLKEAATKIQELESELAGLSI